MFFKKTKQMKAAYEKAMSENARLQAENVKLQAELHENQHMAATIAAEDAIKELSTDNDRLKEQLRNALCTKSGGWSRAAFCYAELANCSIEELRSRHSNYEVHETENGKWLVVTCYCSRCGCDLGMSFDKEHKALVYALMLTSAGFTPALNSICSTCQ